MGGLPLCIPRRGRGEWGVLARVLGQRLQAKMGVSRGGRCHRPPSPALRRRVGGLVSSGQGQNSPAASSRLGAALALEGL